MQIEFLEAGADARPVHLISAGELEDSGAGARAYAWAQANGYAGKAGRLLVLPGADGTPDGAFFGHAGSAETLRLAALSKELPEGDWRLEGDVADATLATLALKLGAYEYTRYRKETERKIRFAVPGGADFARASRLAEGVFLTRDLINTPTNDMGPDQLEEAVRTLGKTHGAEVSVIAGDALLGERLFMIHAVGRASIHAPRLIDLRWGPKDAPAVTLVGKGVCFDTGGLDIKPASGMLLMKKDMGGAANVLGLASMIMAAKLKLRLRVLIPAVENSISGDAFRPGDVLQSRKGVTVEIGNTDAEGRLILADALALADEEEPSLLVDMATLTGAARVALGPDLPPFYTDDDGFAAELETASAAVSDPLWRMPLWTPYASKLDSKIADMNNVTTDGFAGSITAALFLRRFVEKTASWVHFDVFGWNPTAKPWSPVGGEAQCIRALEHVLTTRHGG
ncbi:MAG: leucyl aminopeptidase family protein [Rhizobiaceae bacterium]|nr:leucyl aminopeptidase family protein [Rhizobiaceae bacterium]